MKSQWCKMIVKSVQGMVVGLLLFFLCIGVFTLLLLHTPLAEEGMPYYVFIATAVSCFWAGLQQGVTAGKRGLLLGMMAAAVVMLSLMILCMVWTTGSLVVATLRPMQGLVLLFGGLGGVLGANLTRG